MAQQRQNQIDVKLTDAGDEPDALGLEICRVLAHKGFCTLSTHVSEEGLDLARGEAKDVHRQNRFIRPNANIQEALLGSGSAEIAEFLPPWSPENEHNGTTLTGIDNYMAEVALDALQFSPSILGFEAADRTLCWLHRTDDDPPGSEEEMTPERCSTWLNQFVRQRVMILFALGPKGGTLEMQPYDNDSHVFQVKVAAGTMVILRADLLSHSFSSRDGECVLVSWLCSSNTAGAISAYNVGLESPQRIPIVQVLLDWAWNKIAHEKEQQEDGVLCRLDSEMPREWQLAASRRLMRNRIQVAIRGISLRVPNSIDEEGLYASMICGCDFGQPVGKQRWDHAEYYDPDPESNVRDRFKTCIKHACFIEGADLFDNRFFGISNMEARIMEPMQKHTLEVTYEALHVAGYTSKGEKTHTKLAQKYIGCYVGACAGELMYIPHEQGVGCAGSDGSPAIMAGRISFALGIQGPSYCMQAEHATALLTIHEGAFDVLPSSYVDKPLVEASACVGVYVNLSPIWWPLYTARMCPVGRTFSFDQDAGGHIRADGVSTVVLKRHGEVVDGEFVVDNDAKTFGTLSGWCTTNNGRSASLHAPNAAAQQMVLHDCLRQAGISPLDIDFVACQGEAQVLHDSVEFLSISKILRREGRCTEEVLPITGVACRMGMSQEAQGLSNFFMAMVYQRNGSIAASLHLNALNPYIEQSEAEVTLTAEALPLRLRSSFVGVSAQGFSGTNVHIQMRNDVAEDRSPPPNKCFKPNFFAFWPGGGGQIEYSAEPVKGYTVLGSWSSWRDLEPMRRERDGTYSLIVTLGENRFEQFQILLDGDRSRTLHPGRGMAPMGSAVLGPDVSSQVEANNWLLDGRPMSFEHRGDTSTVDALSVEEVKTQFTGIPGDQYRICLQVLGKWRTVVWEKLTDASGVTLRQPVPRGRYYVSGSWDNWDLEEMQMIDAERSWCALEVCLCDPGERFFQVVRNMDPGQVFYPAHNDGNSVQGPDGDHRGQCWELDGAAGDVFRIEFRRSFELGLDVKNIYLDRIGTRTLREEQERKQRGLEGRAAGRRAQEEREAAELEELLLRQGHL